MYVIPIIRESGVKTLMFTLIKFQKWKLNLNQYTPSTTLVQMNASSDYAIYVVVVQVKQIILCFTNNTIVLGVCLMLIKYVTLDSITKIALTLNYDNN